MKRPVAMGIWSSASDNFKVRVCFGPFHFFLQNVLGGDSFLLLRLSTQGFAVTQLLKQRSAASAAKHMAHICLPPWWKRGELSATIREEIKREIEHVCFHSWPDFQALIPEKEIHAQEIYRALRRRRGGGFSEGSPLAFHFILFIRLLSEAQQLQSTMLKVPFARAQS